MAEYTLPELDYDYGALEPHISGQINEIHHSKHHATYVKGANDALAKLEERARERRPLRDLPQREEPRLPPRRARQPHDLVEEPVPQRRRQADRRTGRGDRRPVRLVRQVPRAVHRRRQRPAGLGLGGARLRHAGPALLTFQLYDQQANVPLGIIPLLQVDMWEHAYYLQYKNVKADYVKAFWNVVNWADVQKRFAAPSARASSLKATTGARSSGRPAGQGMRPSTRSADRALLIAHGAPAAASGVGFPAGFSSPLALVSSCVPADCWRILSGSTHSRVGAMSEHECPRRRDGDRVR